MPPSVVRFVSGLSAEGGGDDPEPVDEALEVALAMDVARRRPGSDHRDRRRARAGARGKRQALAFAEQFRRSAPGQQRAAHGIRDLHRREPAAAASSSAWPRPAAATSCDHQGQMIESVLLSVLRRCRAREDRDDARFERGRAGSLEGGWVLSGRDGAGAPIRWSSARPSSPRLSRV